MSTIAKQLPNTDVDGADHSEENSAISTLTVTFQGVFILQFEERNIKVIMPEVKHHSYTLSTKPIPKDAHYALKGLEKNPRDSPEDLGWRPDLLLKFSTSVITSPKARSHAQMTLPYPKRIEASNALSVVFLTPDGELPRLASGSCSLDYDVSDSQEFRTNPFPWNDIPVKNGNASVEIRTALAPGMDDMGDQHAKAAFAATVKFLPDVHGWALISASAPASSPFGSGANCKAPMVVVVPR
jgi:hypothetical protein